MRAAQVRALEGPDGVRVEDGLVEPVASDGEALVDVHAVGLSFPDLLMSQGRYQIQPELPFVLGVDFAGVERTTGRRVAGWSTYGSAAETVAVSRERLFPLPDEVSFVHGAGLPLNYLTAHFALAVRAGVTEGRVVVVNGAAGGVGSAAVQVASALGARVVAMVSSDAEARFAATVGADETMVGPSAEHVRELTGGAGADVVLDVVGSEEVVLESLRSLATGGRFLSLGYVAGEIPAVRLNRLLLGNLDVSGVAWGPWTRAHPGFAARQWSELVPWMRSGALAPAVHQVLDLAEAAAGLRGLAERRSLGKTVLMVRNDAL